MENILAVIILFPFIGFLINGILGKKLPTFVIASIGCIAPLASFGLSLFTLQGIPLTQRIFDWITVGNFTINFGLTIDGLSRIMLFVVTGVGFLIHLYSIGYMKHDKGFARYFSYLNLFMASMLILIMADNLLLMFVGWEGVGLCSYLLIGFWFEDLKNADAGKKAFIVNRVGDFGFILGMFFLYTIFDTLTMSEIGRIISLDENNTYTEALLIVPTLLLFLGACGKSAQIPLYVWLPDAMAGPTPVSALIHAATMVTAGIYMLSRLHFLFLLTPFTMDIIGVTATLTALMTAIIALGQNDIKKILAYSTISQLGYMFMGAAASDFSSGIFHLTTHAFFKALLFLSAGAVIHALQGEQDITKMGGLRGIQGMGFIFIVFLIGALALSGVPPFAGFFSKDEILAALYTKAQNGNFLWLCMWISALITAMLTALYTFRLIFIAFFGKCNLTSEKLHHIHKPDWSMKIALFMLGGLSIIGGIFGEIIHESEIPTIVPEGHSLNLILSICVVTLGITLAYIIYIHKRFAVKAQRLITNKFYIDEIYELIIIKPLRMFASILWRLIDRAIIDSFFVNGIAFVSQATSRQLKTIHTGMINRSLFIMVIGVLVILMYVLVRI